MHGNLPGPGPGLSLNTGAPAHLAGNKGPYIAIEMSIVLSCLYMYSSLRKKVEPKRLQPAAVLENGNTLEDGAVFFFFIIIMFRTFFRRKQLHLWKWHQNSATGGAELRTMK